MPSTTLELASPFISTGLSALPPFAAGHPVDNPAHAIRFKIFNAPTGGSILWFEDQITAVSAGKFTVTLGAVKPLPPSVFQPDNPVSPKRFSLSVPGQRWIEMLVGGVKLTPRQKLDMSSHSDNTDALDGLHAANLARATHTHSFTRVLSVPGEAFVPTTNVNYVNGGGTGGNAVDLRTLRRII